MIRRLSLVAAALVLLAPPAAALANHDTQYQWGEKEYPVLNPAMKDVPMPTFVGGPCTGVARLAMPASPEHGDHLDITRHNFSCGVKKVFFDDLTTVLADRPEVMLGEMDVKKNLAVIATAYPESGFLLYDVSNPAQPKFLSHYRGEECEQVLTDVDCGAYVDLSPDGKRVYMSIQQTSVLPNPSTAMRPSAVPGVQVVDISIPTLPILLQQVPIAAIGGVHTTKSFVVPDKGGDGPREPGEYLISIANAQGLAINQVLPTGNVVPVGTIDIGEAHDTFVQDDPILHRTLLYAAGGFSSGFYVWDITAPSAPVPVGEWDPTPECENDWYAHTIDVTVRNGHRMLTMPNELIDFFGTQSDPECGDLKGNGDYTGGMWFVDITDLSQLGKFSSDNATHEPPEVLKPKSLAMLKSMYYNPAFRAGGELTFSLHNQQIVGDKIYVSQYHGGVLVLDAKDALDGKNVRPKEVAIYVPHEGKPRPIPPDAGGPLNGGAHFITGFIDYRPLIWDMTYVNGHIVIPDMTGGLSVVKEDDSPGAVVDPGAGPVAGPACADSLAPTARLTKATLTRKGIRLSGRAADRGCGRVAHVSIGLARLGGKKCAFLSSLKRFGKAGSCRKPILVTAKGTSKWTYTLRMKLRKGRYAVLVRATDTAGNQSRILRKAARLR